MRNTVTLNLHENYVQVIVRFHKQTYMSHVEYALCGSNVCELIKEPCSIATLKENVSSFKEDDRDVTKPYLKGFNGHFSLTYKLIDADDITAFEVLESRYVSETRGGRNVSGGFKDKLFGKKILLNLINAAATKDVKKLNRVTGALYSIGN